MAFLYSMHLAWSSHTKNRHSATFTSVAAALASASRSVPPVIAAPVCRAHMCLKSRERSVGRPIEWRRPCARGTVSGAQGTRRAGPSARTVHMMRCKERVVKLRVRQHSLWPQAGEDRTTLRYGSLPVGGRARAHCTIGAGPRPVAPVKPPPGGPQQVRLAGELSR